MSSDLSVLVPWVIAHGYLLILLVGIIGGAFVAAASGAAVALGYFNIYIILILVFLADFIGDLLYFYIGYFSQNLNKYKFFRNFTAKKESKKIKSFFLKNKVKAIVIIKLSPGISFLGLIFLGSLRISCFKFIKTAAPISLLKSFFFFFLGYLSGKAGEELSSIIVQAQYLVLSIIIILILIYFVYLKLIKLISKKLQKKEEKN